MSNIEVRLEDNNFLIIEKKTSRANTNNIENIQLDLLRYGEEYISEVKITNDEGRNKIFLISEVKDRYCCEDEENDELDDIDSISKNVIIVYSDNKKIKYSYCSMEKAYKKLLKLKFKVLNIKLNKRRLKIKVLAYLINKYNLDIAQTSFFIDEKLSQECNLSQYENKLSKLKILKQKHIFNFKFKISDIINDDSIINSSMKFNINIEGNDIEYKIGKKDKKIANKKLKKKYYNLPLKHVYVNDYSIHIRRTIGSNFVLVKRLKDPIEDTIRFKVLESKFISAILYKFGKLFTKIRRKKVNIFYEKFASKAEEGVFDLYKMCKESKKTKSYFVIDKDSIDYDRIKNDPGVIKKYSFKYYWMIYNCTHFIASEAPSHLNVLRSNNKYFRKATYDKDFIFLQHGIIYMKNLGLNSAFSKSKEAESKYMIVSSEKEKDVVTEMLGYNEETLLKTGLGMYSNIKYNHINSDSDDFITVMLTWKPYEEQLYDFEQSSYYKNVIEICNMLQKYIPKEKIIIIAHPKAQTLIENTDLKDRLWNLPISKALEKTKLLITDYSSVCYNSFYQGAGVIFYQPDLELYEQENGKLIPSDDEYIGERAFDIERLELLIQENTKNGKIILDNLRTKKFEENYKTINEFCDGKNIERIYESLLNLNII